MPVTPELLTAMAGLPLGGIALFLMYKLSSNHIEHSGQAIDRLAGAVEKMNETNTSFHSWLKGKLGAEEDAGKD